MNRRTLSKYAARVSAWLSGDSISRELKGTVEAKAEGSQGCKHVLCYSRQSVNSWSVDTQFKPLGRGEIRVLSAGTVIEKDRVILATVNSRLAVARPVTTAFEGRLKA